MNSHVWVMDTFSDDESIPDKKLIPNEEVKKQVNEDRVERWQDGLLLSDDLNAPVWRQKLSHTINTSWCSNHLLKILTSATLWASLEGGSVLEECLPRSLTSSWHPHRPHPPTTVTQYQSPPVFRSFLKSGDFDVISHKKTPRSDTFILVLYLARFLPITTLYSASSCFVRSSLSSAMTPPFVSFLLDTLHVRSSAHPRHSFVQRLNYRPESELLE